MCGRWGDCLPRGRRWSTSAPSCRGRPWFPCSLPCPSSLMPCVVVRRMVTVKPTGLVQASVVHWKGGRRCGSVRDPLSHEHRRGVAQPGSAPVWGTGGRRFKSSLPDHDPPSHASSSYCPGSVTSTVPPFSNDRWMDSSVETTPISRRAEVSGSRPKRTHSSKCSSACRNDPWIRPSTS